MKKLLFYVLFWMFTGGLYLRGSAGEIGRQSLEPQIENSVTDNITVRLKEIDVANPLFIFK